MHPDLETFGAKFCRRQTTGDFTTGTPQALLVQLSTHTTMTNNTANRLHGDTPRAGCCCFCPSGPNPTYATFELCKKQFLDATIEVGGLPASFSPILPAATTN